MGETHATVLALDKLCDWLDWVDSSSSLLLPGKNTINRRACDWDVGWVLTAPGDVSKPADAPYQVAWVEDGKMYTKTVQQVYPTDIPLHVAQRPNLIP